MGSKREGHAKIISMYVSPTEITYLVGGLTHPSTYRIYIIEKIKHIYNNMKKIPNNIYIYI